MGNADFEGVSKFDKGVLIMGSGKRKDRSVRQRKSLQYHKLSVFSICGVVVLLAVILGVGSISLHAKNKEYKAHEIELEKQLAEEKVRAEEIEDLEEYVGTDEYIKDVAKEKLRLIDPNEILFKTE